MRTILLIPLFYLMSGCVSLAAETQQNMGVLSIKNNTFDIIVDIYLDKDFYKDFSLDKNNIAAQNISITNKENHWLVFNPIDPDTLRSSKGYYSKVWSPDSKYLVLPLGRFEGFAIFDSGYLQNNLKNLVTQYNGTELVPEKTFLIFSESGPALWHEFVGWEGEHTLVVKAGLGKDLKQFRYDIQKEKLSGYKYWKGRITQSRVISVDAATQE